MKFVDLTHVSTDFRSLSRKHTVLDTRIDAPALIADDGITVDQLLLERLLFDAVLLDLTEKADGRPIDDEDLEGAEERAGLAVRESEIVLLHVTRGRFPQDDEFSFNYPYLSENGAEYLRIRHVGGVGIDAPNLEKPMNHELPVHEALLKSGIFILENLKNLEIPDRERFSLIALPPRVKAVSAIVRVVAALDE